MISEHHLNVSFSTFVGHFAAKGAQIRSWRNAYGQPCAILARAIGRRWWAVVCTMDGVKVFQTETPNAG